MSSSSSLVSDPGVGGVPSLTPLPPQPRRRRLGAPLPVPISSLVGRAPLIESIRGLLAEEGVRLLTLTGPGGTGKSRLALATAAELDRAGVFPDGVAFVPLAPLADPGHVLSAV